MTQIITIIGWKNSGKTTLAVGLIEELTRRGYRVASIKHAHHAADIDHADTDTFRHRAAGAAEVALVTSVRWAIIHELDEEPEPSLEAIVAKLAPADIVIVEGYKQAAVPKIEVRRRAAKGDPIAPNDANVIAIASDAAESGGKLPHFDANDIAALADFVVRSLALRPAN